MEGGSISKFNTSYTIAHHFHFLGSQTIEYPDTYYSHNGTHCYLAHCSMSRDYIVGPKFPKQNIDICIVNGHIFICVFFLQKTPLTTNLKFQLSLYQHYNCEKGVLYSPDDMKLFAQNDCPGLWETFLSAITNDRSPITSDRADLQKRRIVALLHILAYFRYETHLMK